jgi:hypothetical protein
VTYRDDHEAARQRVSVLERELAIARREGTALARGGRDWTSLIGRFLAAGATGTFTVLALWIGWSAWWASFGFVFFAIAVITLLAGKTTPNPTGAVPVRIEAGERVLVALVRMHPGDHSARALELYAGHTHAEVAAAAAVVLEPLLLDGTQGEVATAVARERLAGIGLQLEHLWISPSERAA